MPAAASEGGGSAAPTSPRGAAGGSIPASVTLSVETGRAPASAAPGVPAAGSAAASGDGGAATAIPSLEQLAAFTRRVWQQGERLYRDLPWRNTRDPYAILVSEVMLQQTQVSRVLGRWEQWLEAFPTAQSLATAPVTPVLELWQGMGYNRRALNLKRSAEEVVARFGGHVPQGREELLSLPGVGPATAAGVRAFAFCQPGVYLETNVRTVFLHELYQGRDKVRDKELEPLVAVTCPEAGPQVRSWYYALLDYGAHLKRTQPNPSRRSAQHTRQSAFEGSHRQKRAYLLRRVLEAPASTGQLADDLSQAERSAGRPALSAGQVAAIMEELAGEGFVEQAGGLWHCRE